MKLLSERKLSEVLQMLPDIFTLQPTTDYQALISHSASELSRKTSLRTNSQMSKAYKHAESMISHVRKP
ncbi:MAG: hypothetical protein GX342_04125 [Alcaligenaceae bacterium]|jgi:hypothetical protein|nr:hypothetical protein [Alcaligenaceae bacterium]